MTASAASAVCPKCGTHLGAALRSCPQCHWLIHGQELKRLAAEAEQSEAAGDLAGAVTRWQDAQLLLPPESRQNQVIQEKVRLLGERMVQEPGAASKPAAPRPEWTKKGGVLGALLLIVWKLKFALLFLLTKAKLLVLGLTKLSTLLSMLLAFGVYWGAWGWPFAAGLIVSIYIHEMGHVAALSKYGIRASAPMFIPGFGALVRLHRYPPTPALDARVGLAGPLWGLAAALAALGMYAVTDAPIWAAIARVGAWMNLFNLLPLWSLDGGRGFRTFTREDRWLAVAFLVTVWFVSHESLLVLLAIGAGIQAFAPAAEKRDLPMLGLYAVLVGSLTALSLLPVALP